ncbi:hypothetical protein M0R45_032036 [Rubus argutus]|uniref:Uncharacterized protein n=1 Tax=Rubus argutus TaxID=59490 RepID=A0AAW1WIC1_RUBAR
MKHYRRLHLQKETHFEGGLESSLDSCFDDKAALAAADMAAAATPSLAPPAAFIAPATFANAAIPPTSIALKATVGFIAIPYATCNFQQH